MAQLCASIALFIVLAYLAGVVMPAWYVRIFHPVPKCPSCGHHLLPTYDGFWYCLRCRTHGL